MKIQENILQYFDNIIQSIKKMEKGSEVFNELKGISEELEVLQNYVKTTLTTLEHNFDAFVKQINLLSELVDFQRSVINYKSSENVVRSLFEFLQRNIPNEHSFIAFRLKEESEDIIVATHQKDFSNLYKEFYLSAEMQTLESLVKERDMAYLISDTDHFNNEKLSWDKFTAKSIILFPIKVQGKFLGIGFLIRSFELFALKDLSFINLNIGLISFIVYQHFYFEKLKSKLFKQFRLRRMMQEVKYAEYFEKGPLFIFTLDPRFVVLHANTAALSNLALNEESIIGENFLDIIPKSNRSQFKNILEKCEQGRIDYFQSSVLSKKKVEPIFEFFINKIELQNRFNLILVFALEITQSYYREKLLQRNKILDELDQFSRTVVGEFNNLLTIIVPTTSLIRTQLSEDNLQQTRLESMEKAANRSAGLVKKFLNYDLEEFDIAEFGDLNKLLQSYVQPLKENTDSNIEIKFQLEPGLKKIQYYPLRLRKLLKILYTNSIEALNGRQNPEIRISTQQINQKYSGLLGEKTFYLTAGEYIELCFYDNGCGIPEQSLEQVFKPFYSTKIKNEGVGLGLFIAYNIVKDFKGEIFVESVSDKFTEVSIYFPMKSKDIKTVVADQKVNSVNQQITRKPTILVVDDEYNIRSMMKEIMEMGGFDVFTAGNGRDGVDVFQRHQDTIDLIILDMVMPVMDGRTAFLEIRKIKPDQKIFIISGYSSREDMDEILQKGAIGFMRKPFQVAEIIGKIREILNIN
jgi:two-component system cell cycle sensor histidine kinase/response regulator CckA